MLNNFAYLLEEWLGPFHFGIYPNNMHHALLNAKKKQRE